MPQNETTEFYTVVYRVEGGKRQNDEWWQSVHGLFLSDGPVSITTIAAGDQLNELEESGDQDAE